VFCDAGDDSVVCEVEDVSGLCAADSLLELADVEVASDAVEFVSGADTPESAVSVESDSVELEVDIESERFASLGEGDDPDAVEELVSGTAPDVVD
jgi:hypothetical protein